MDAHQVIGSRCTYREETSHDTCLRVVETEKTGNTSYQHCYIAPIESLHRDDIVHMHQTILQLGLIDDELMLIHLEATHIDDTSVLLEGEQRTDCQ